MAKVSPLMILPPAIFLAVAGLFYAGMMRENPDSLPSELTGKPAPVVELTPLGDRPLLTDAAVRSDGVKLVNFWASWCAPCRVEHPQLMAMAEDGIPVHGINYKDESANALNFLAGLGDPYTLSGADRNGRNAIEWGVYGVPETFVVAGDGTVVLRFAGPITTAIMRDKILPAIAEAEALTN
ncbi:DsbE family thiol:disulfide interchange protein [Tropicimonas sediminicola]|uniref:Cytochrome c biogenesis protein CcmG, thiol:disulfide interchange protein DsbE n=1 Tax=Tropicimonas sediminicola TaxID=1031541 RepID=A0A239HMS6_9RHOB|nr:DsbE family thiol:disulfide interchange protein [Tropicimonas sediminicola]SNS82143.1 cytochrome c biogenesis protein CcmG, thiol:disulfide interchange protein DsbE [Tropicimonas sediminicola]